jgi:hypothetical protein
LGDRTPLIQLAKAALRSISEPNPFENLPDGELLCFREDNASKISDFPDNRRWIQQIYGDAAYEALKDRQPSCSGTTIGSHPAILHYLELMLKHAKPEISENLREYRGHDQGIHNYLLRTGSLPGSWLVTNGQHVYSMGGRKHDRVKRAVGKTFSHRLVGVARLSINTMITLPRSST